MLGTRHLFQREEQPRRTARCWNTCMGQGICFKEKNSRVLEYVHGARYLFQSEEQPSVGTRARGKAFVSKRRTAECLNTCMGQGICFKEKSSRVLEYVHGERHLFQREEQPSVGIRAWGKAFVSKRRTAACCITCMGKGICFKEKNSRVFEYLHGARHLFQRDEQPSVGTRAWGKRRTAECWNTCRGQEKNSRVLEHMQVARGEQPGVGTRAGDKRRTAEVWNTCRGQEKNSRVLEHVQGAIEEQPCVGIRAGGKRRRAECWNMWRGQEKNS